MIKVLLIDDDVTFLDLLATTLREQEFQVFTAPSGFSGVALARSEHPDVILLDLILTDMPGLEVLRRIKDGESTAAIPVVMLTSYGNEKVETEADTLGISGYLHKYQVQLKDMGPYVKELLEKTKNTAPAESTK